MLRSKGKAKVEIAIAEARRIGDENGEKCTLSSEGSLKTSFGHTCRVGLFLRQILL